MSNTAISPPKVFCARVHLRGCRGNSQMTNPNCKICFGMDPVPGRGGKGRRTQRRSDHLSEETRGRPTLRAANPSSRIEAAAARGEAPNFKAVGLLVDYWSARFWTASFWSKHLKS